MAQTSNDYNQYLKQNYAAIADDSTKVSKHLNTLIIAPGHVDIN